MRSATLERVVWYPILTRILGADLIITEPATRNLINYVLYVCRRLGGPAWRFWGHGWNHFLDDRNSLAERIKHRMGKHADWYFAYTREVKEGLVDRGYSSAKITDVQNAWKCHTSRCSTARRRPPSETDGRSVRRIRWRSIAAACMAPSASTS